MDLPSTIVSICGIVELVPSAEREHTFSQRRTKSKLEELCIL